jgi:CubicO group peptidase (beta-lactamase class C family)
MSRLGLTVGAPLVLAVALASPTPSFGRDAKPATPAGDPKVVSALDAAVRTAAGEDFWGTVLVAERGKVVFAKGYGFADYDERPNAPDTLFELASTSKQFTAAAILRLEQQKRLKTSASLLEFFPKAPKDKKKVTLDHLLHHTSGLDPSLGVAYSWPGNRDRYVEEMLEKPLVATPGEKHSYSNVGYALLAAVVEVVAKTEFEEYVRKEIFKPAGLSDTGFIGEKRLIESDRVTKRACDDCEPDWTAAKWWYGWGYRGMGGVVSTALDLVAWDRALRGTKVLGAAAKKKLYEPHLERYACGWVVEPGERGGTKVSHSGGVRGYGIQYARWLEDDVVVVVLSNGKKSPHAVEAAVARAYWPLR